jgi:hypothetical protein
MGVSPRSKPGVKHVTDIPTMHQQMNWFNANEHAQDLFQYRRRYHHTRKGYYHDRLLAMRYNQFFRIANPKWRWSAGPARYDVRIKAKQGIMPK